MKVTVERGMLRIPLDGGRKEIMVYHLRDVLRGDVPKPSEILDAVEAELRAAVQAREQTRRSLHALSLGSIA